MAPRFLRLCVVTVLILFGTVLFAQPRGMRMGGYQMNNVAWIVGSVVLSPDEEGGEEIPGAGVTVMVITLKEQKDKTLKATDTLYTTVSNEGRFFFRIVPVGKAYVRFSMIGYEEESNLVSITPGENKFLANLKPVKYTIDGAVISEKVSPISVKGDTIIFNAAAVKTLKGEMAIDILEQMPGVEVTEASVSVLGETVTNVYVDGALLFGQAPMKALENIPAEEVTTIKSYQEYANKDPFHKISKNEDKQRVLDIQTKSKPKLVTAGDFLAGGGFDTDSTYHKPRYTFGGSAFLSSESLQASLNFNINNINDASVRMRGASFRSARGGGSADLRMASVGLNVTKKWMSPTTRNFVLGAISAAYSFSDQYNVSESISERIYFPTSAYNYRKAESSSYSKNGSSSHSLHLGGNKALKDGMISAGLHYTFGDRESSSRSRNYNFQDALPRQGTSNSTVSDSRNQQVSAELSANKGFNDKLRLGGGVGYSYGSSGGTSTKIDTTTSTITNTVLDISSDGDSRLFNAHASIGYELSERSSIGVRYNYSNSFNQSLQWAYDVTDPAQAALDSINTQFRTNDNNTHTVTSEFRTALADDNVTMSVQLAMNSVGINRSDDFPESDSWARRFNSLRPSLRLANKSQLNHWNFSYSGSSGTPSVEQVRPKLNNSNLYRVSAGNPDLKQSYNNKISASYSTVLGREARETIREMEEDEGGRIRENQIRSDFTTFSVNVGFSTTNDVIAGRSIYFTEETYLPEYNYTMPAQSTFQSYANAGNSYSANASVRFGTPVKFIGSIVSTGLSMNWDSSPSYVDGNLITTRNTRPTFSLGIRSNFSRTIRFNISGNGSYVHSANTAGKRTDYFTEALSAGVELNNILKLMYFSGNYTKTFMQGINYANARDNILDLRGGVRFGPRNNFDISVMVHDLFNKTSGFSTSTHADYVANSWNHSFGRYVMLTLAYRFNRLGNQGGGPGGPGGGMRGGGQGGPGGGPRGGGQGRP